MYSYGVSELVVFKDMNTEVFVVYLIALCLIVKKSCFNKTNDTFLVHLSHFRQHCVFLNTQWLTEMCKHWHCFTETTFTLK